MKRYRIDNWAQYNRALVQRGSITIWVEDGSIEAWMAERKKGQRGRPKIYSDEAILMLLTLREVYRLPLRGLQGLVSSIFFLMGLTLPIPCYTQVCRRAKLLKKVLKSPKIKGPVDVVFDSTGLKVYGEGEWKVRKHGAGKRRTWKKLHIGIDPSSQQIMVAELTDRDGGDASVAEEMLDKIRTPLGRVLGDGAYDSSAFRQAVDNLGADILVPPPKNGSYKGAQGGWERKRDAALVEIKVLGGDDDARALWKKLTGYHQRSLVETTMYRLKHILGGRLKSRSTENQAVEVQCKCLILNKMARLGLPKGRWVEEAS